MKILRGAAVGFAALHLAGSIPAKDKGEWWDKPYAKWNPRETAKLFSDSPWVKTWGFSLQKEGEHGSTGFGAPAGAIPASEPNAPSIPSGQPSPPADSAAQPETRGVDLSKDTFTVRLFSAQPVREAFVRMLQLMNNYDSLSPERKQIFDSKIGGLATADPGNEVTVAVAFHSNDPQHELDLKRFFGSATTATLSQSAYLYTTSAGQVTLLKYIPPDPTLGGRFVFPRTEKNGEPILKPEDKMFRFQLNLPPEGSQNLYVDFKPAKMIFRGALSY